jgi:RNA polymerase subunit RPABC4/transcription elongation factor Spt4
MNPQSTQPQSNVLIAATAPQSRAPYPPHRYSVWFLGLLCSITLIYEIFMWGFDPQPPGALFGIVFLAYLGVIVSILAVDWRHLLTLHGHVNWATLSWPGRILMALLYVILTILLFSMPVLYLAFAVKDTIDQRRNSAPAVKLKTAELEAELGYLPQTEGECPQCHKPLQAGAEFCAYCGTPLASKPRICNKCATIAPPDAIFCPKCGTPFGQS